MIRRPLAFVLLAVLVASLAGCDSVKSRYWMNEGNKLYKGQKYEAAIAEYEKVLGIHPGDWAASYQIAVSYLAMYHPNSTHPKDLEYSQKAAAALEKLLKMKAPDQETIEKVRGFYVGLLQAANQTDKAVTFYEGLVRENPKNALYTAQLAQLYAKKGDFQKALEYFTKRTEIEPSNKEALYTVGVVCWERSYRGGLLVSDDERRTLIAKGMDALERAVKLDPDYFEALSYVNLLHREKAKVLANAGDLEGAQAEIQKATEVTKRAVEARKKQLAAAKPS